MSWVPTHTHTFSSIFQKKLSMILKLMIINEVSWKRSGKCCLYVAVCVSCVTVGSWLSTQRWISPKPSSAETQISSTSPVQFKLQGRFVSAEAAWGYHQLPSSSVLHLLERFFILKTCFHAPYFCPDIKVDDCNHPDAHLHVVSPYLKICLDFFFK